MQKFGKGQNVPVHSKQAKCMVLVIYIYLYYVDILCVVYEAWLPYIWGSLSLCLISILTILCLTLTFIRHRVFPLRGGRILCCIDRNKR